MNIAKILVGTALAILVGCGGGDAAPPKSPPPAAAATEAAPSAEPKTVQEAQDQIAQAVADLNGNNSSAGKASDTAKKSSSTTPGTAADEAPADTCATPCRALASMKRAVDALCRMTGEGDDKCLDARKTLATNVGKTASCKCSI